MNNDFDFQIRMIPVKQIEVLNPRTRGKKKFAQIVANIAKLGLKKPVTVAQLENKKGQEAYLLVCGQGRLESFIELGEEFIPAFVIEGTREQLLLISLAENIARRRHSTMELVSKINSLKESGYSPTEISIKIDLAATSVRGILQLLAKGEEKLLQAVEMGIIPVSIAVTIATADDVGIQRALAEAYEKNGLRGRALLDARRLIEKRRTSGKRLQAAKRMPVSPVSVDDLLKTYQKETIRQRLTIQRAKVCETRLLFATSALKQLFLDENFVTLLRAEGLESLPQYLAIQILDQETAA